METQLLTLKNDPTRRFAGIQYVYRKRDENQLKENYVHKRLQEQIQQFVDDSILTIYFKPWNGFYYNFRDIPGNMVDNPPDRDCTFGLERDDWVLREIIDEYDNTNVAVVSEGDVEKYYNIESIIMYKDLGNYEIYDFVGGYNPKEDDFGKTIVMRSSGKHIWQGANDLPYMNVYSKPSMVGKKLTIVNGGNEDIEIGYELKPLSAMADLSKWILKPDHYIVLRCESDEKIHPCDLGVAVRESEPYFDFAPVLEKWGIK